MSRFSTSTFYAAAVVAALALFGITAIYSAGFTSSEFPVRSHWINQSMYVAIGGAAAVGLALWDNRRWSWRWFVWAGYALSIVLLVAVLFAGRTVGGARRWLVVGPFFLQPAEFARLFTLLAGAAVLSGECFRAGRRWLELPAAIAVFAVPMVLILLEPSYGNACSLLPCLAVLLAVRYLPPWLFSAALTCIVLALIAAAVSLQYLRAAPPKSNAAAADVSPASGFFRGYHLRRLQSYLTPKGGWNEQQSLMAIAGGGLTGKGFLNGTMKNLGYLPRTVAPTDYIFAVVAEEGGLLFGVIPLLTLYAMLIAVMLHWAVKAQNRLDLLLITAATTLIAMHVVVSVGMTIRLMPVIGLPLPLLSYGGSFTLTILALIGVAAGARHPPSDGNEQTAAPPGIKEIKLGRLAKLRIKIRGGGNHLI